MDADFSGVAMAGSDGQAEIPVVVSKWSVSHQLEESAEGAVDGAAAAASATPRLGCGENKTLILIFRLTHSIYSSNSYKKCHFPVEFALSTSKYCILGCKQTLQFQLLPAMHLF